MNEDLQRVVIARECGWKDVGLRLYNEGTGMDAYIWTSGVLGRGGREIPDYTRDLNAMSEAEKTLVTTGRWIEYTKCLAKLTYVNKTVWETAVRYSNGDMDAVFHDLSSIVRATAAQRAEAFLRAVSKWEGAPL